MSKGKLRFTLIGSRKAPKEECDILKEAAVTLLEAGAFGLSGGAQGCDHAFTEALLHMAAQCNVSASEFGQIHIPWNGFNDLYSGQYDGACYLNRNVYMRQHALGLARMAHPYWHNLSSGGRALHGRNPYQILGDDLDTPTNVVICWAKTNKAGDVLGGTATACTIARQWVIPVINLYTSHGHLQLEQLLSLVSELPIDTDYNFTIDKNNNLIHMWN